MLSHTTMDVCSLLFGPFLTTLHKCFHCGLFYIRLPTGNAMSEVPKNSNTSKCQKKEFVNAGFPLLHLPLLKITLYNAEPQKMNF